MAKALKINKNTEEGLLQLLEFLLDSEKVEGIFSLKKLNKNGNIAYSLITNKDELKGAVPLDPHMPVNAGKILSHFTLAEKTKRPVAAVLRPCELRAFVELIKRAQGSLENILLISLSCGGVFPIDTMNNGDAKKRSSSYAESLKKAENSPDVRKTCQSCDNFLPQLADMTVLTVGKKDADKECIIYLNTKQGENFAKDAPGNTISAEIESSETEKLKSKRKENKEKLFKDFEKTGNGISGFSRVFAACLGCHGCGEACPICYCTLCDFDSKTCEYKPESYESELEHKGGLKIPPGTLFYHLGRMSHMAVSCVACGMCSDVCPVNIPVADVFTKVGAALQDVFQYSPGKDIEEPVPSGTFKEEEFKEVGEH
ncbi:MAG: Coenzyme F420 hydrogenase/dehydrogenase, beta subunit C-terminal domain [Candidatus Aminicenantes bacterium]|nr:Coenzyme F420 hydrogenase/dehydrogenase, beta subunit C-terminal domain [Candidatus Aminicenantes bacterium]